MSRNPLGGPWMAPRRDKQDRRSQFKKARNQPWRRDDQSSRVVDDGKRVWLSRNRLGPAPSGGLGYTDGPAPPPCLMVTKAANAPYSAKSRTKNRKALR